MPIGINGSGTITGISAGGLPDNVIVADDIASGAVTQAKLGAGVAGNGPAFSAYQNSNQTISSDVFTKLQIGTEEFDTANCYDNTTNYRFTPNVAGYYQINGAMGGTCSTTFAQITLRIYKNGSGYKTGNYVYGSLQNAANYAVASSLVYFNGTTDYVELYGYLSGTGTITVNSGSIVTYFNGCMLRGA